MIICLNDNAEREEYNAHDYEDSQYSEYSESLLASYSYTWWQVIKNYVTNHKHNQKFHDLFYNVTANSLGSDLCLNLNRFEGVHRNPVYETPKLLCPCINFQNNVQLLIASLSV